MPSARHRCMSMSLAEIEFVSESFSVDFILVLFRRENAIAVGGVAETLVRRINHSGAFDKTENGFATALSDANGKREKFDSTEFG